MPIRIGILAVEPESMKAYSDAVQKAGAEPIKATSVAELGIALSKHETTGLLVDVMSKMRSNSTDDRERLSEITNVFPVANVKWSADDNSIMAILGIEVEGDESLESFIKHLEAHGEPRRMRQNPRFKLQFNVRTSLAPHELEQGDPSVTVDISRGGCFIYSMNPHAPGSIFYMTFLELQDKTPVRVKARQITKWGEKMSFPGNGVEFLEFTDAQLKELAKWGIV